MVPSGWDASVAADYSYNGFWPSLRLAAARTALANDDLIIDDKRTTYRQHVLTAVAGTSLPVLVTTESSANLSMSYQYSQYGPADPLPVADPAGGIIRRPETGPLASINLVARLLERPQLGLFDQRPGRARDAADRCSCPTRPSAASTARPR